MYINSHTLECAVMAVKLLTAQVGQKYNSRHGDQNLTIPDGPTLSRAKPWCRGVKRGIRFVLKRSQTVQTNPNFLFI